MSRGRRAVASAAAVAACLGVAACGAGTASDGPTSATEPTSSSATTDSPASPATSPSPTEPVDCFGDVRETPVPPELNNLSFPDRTVVYGVEERGDNGILLTGVSDTAFHDASFQMRLRYSNPPFEVVGYETTESALAANWSGPSISGRWVLFNLSDSCPRDTGIRMLWTTQG